MKKVAIKNKKECTRCKKLQVETLFYKSNSKMFDDGRSPLCKSCIKEMIDLDNIKTVYTVLQQLDIMFDANIWEKSVEVDSDTFGTYMRMVNSLHQFNNTSWNDSKFESSKHSDGLSPNTVINPNKSADFKITEDIVDKWGDGYSVVEYKAFERKYQMLKNNYPEKTAMHTEALITYIRYRVKEELATAVGDSKAAKEWGTLAKDAATAAKINPSQLSKSDLSDGLDTFGQLVRTVEQAIDIIPILPKFKQRPKDSVDFTIWCYVNYVRDLKGLPQVDYQEIYSFYEDRKREYDKLSSDDESGEE